MSAFLAVDDGIFTGKLTLADIMFLVGVILFALATIIRLAARPIGIDGVLIAGGLTAVALGWLVL
jgi:hypothetical protein